LYSIPAVDAHAGVYGCILAILTAEPATGHCTPAKIHTVLNNAGEGFLQAYLLLRLDDHTVTIHIIAYYPTLPGVASAWNRQQFGFLGGVVGPTTQPITFPGATAFNLAPTAVQVPTLNTMGAHWLATGAMELYLLPFRADDADMELIRTCHMALLPFIAVHYCLAPLTMQQLWTVLGQPLVNSRREVKMGVLLNWICIMSVSSTAQVTPVIQLADPPEAPLADTSLLGYLHCMIQRWLLGLPALVAVPQVTVQAPQVVGILHS